MSLPWVRLDTTIGDNPKILALVQKNKHRAALAYVLSLAYSGRHELSGFVPKGALPILHAAPSDARLLIEARLWHEVDGGWEINDFDEYQITNVTQEHRSNAAKIGACRRWHTQPCAKCSPADQEAS